MVIGLSVSGVVVFALVLRAMLRQPLNRKKAGLRAANRVPLSDRD